MKNKLLGALALATLATAGTAHAADVNWQVTIGNGYPAPVYAPVIQPAPVFVPAHPVVVQPRPVYHVVQAAPIYLRPAPVYVVEHPGHAHKHKHKHKHGKRKHWDD